MSIGVQEVIDMCEELIDAKTITFPRVEADYIRRTMLFRMEKLMDDMPVNTAHHRVAFQAELAMVHSILAKIPK